MRLETYRSDLSHELPTSLLEEAIKRCWIGGIGYWSDGTGLYRVARRTRRARFLFGPKGHDLSQPNMRFLCIAGRAMNPFQEKIAGWLSRAGPERALNQCFDLPVVLATDIGLQRTENQDRVAALRISAKSSGGRPLIAVAVADEMP